MTNRTTGNSTAGGGALSSSWTFLSNHAHVLVSLARDPDARLRDIAQRVGITERGAHKIVAELEAGGVIRRLRTGRRNHYDINPEVALRHPLEADRTVGSLLAVLLGPEHAKRLGLRTRVRRRSAAAGRPRLG